MKSCIVCGCDYEKYSIPPYKMQITDSKEMCFDCLDTIFRDMLHDDGLEDDEIQEEEYYD